MGEKVLRELVKIHCVNNNNKKKLFLSASRRFRIQTFLRLRRPPYSRSPQHRKNIKGPIIVIQSKRIYVISVSIDFQIFILTRGFYYYVHICTSKTLNVTNVTALQRYDKSSKIIDGVLNIVLYIKKKKRSQSKTINTIFKFKRAVVINNDYVYYIIVTSRTRQKIIKPSVFNKKNVPLSQR